MTKSVYKEPVKRKADNDTRFSELIEKRRKKATWILWFVIFKNKVFLKKVRFLPVRFLT